MAWINPIFLFGLGAAAVPIIVHLLRSRNARIAALGTLRFLEEALRESRRYRRLRNLLLLLCRIAAVCLLALLFARPYQGAEEEPVLPGRRHVVALVDTSASMGAVTLDVTNLDLALEELERVHENQPEGTVFTVAACSHEVSDMPETPICGGGTDYAAALRWAKERLGASGAPERHVVLITDMQESGLPPAPVTEWPLDLALDIVPVPVPEQWNLAVAEARPSSMVLQDSMGVVVSIVGYGDCPGHPIPVHLRLEGPEGTDVLNAETDPAQGVVSVSWTPPGPGLYRAEVRVETGDAFPLDDIRHAAFYLREAVRVLLVDGAPGRTPFQDETYYLETALKTVPYEGAAPEFQAERRKQLGDITDKDLIVLCNVGMMQGGDMMRLREHVEGGKGLVIFLGDRFDTLVYAGLRNLGLFPADVVLTEEETTVPVYDWNEEHPALQIFGETGGADLSGLLFREAFRVQTGPAAEALAWFSDRTPAIWQTGAAEGRVITVAQPCDREWSDWPAQPAFLPIVRELLRFAHGTTGTIPVINYAKPSIDGALKPGIHGDNPITVVAADPFTEARPGVLEETEFRQRLGLGEAPVPKPAEPEPAAPAGSERDKEVWAWIALTLLAVLMFENMLADKIFSRRGQSARAQAGA